MSFAIVRAARRRAAVVADGAVNGHDDLRTKFDFVASAGVHVRVDGRYPIMSDKFVFAKRRHVETGGVNFSYGAQCRNAENVLVLQNKPLIAALYATRFPSLRNESAE